MRLGIDRERTAVGCNVQRVAVPRQDIEGSIGRADDAVCRVRDDAALASHFPTFEEGCLRASRTQRLEQLDFERRTQRLNVRSR